MYCNGSVVLYGHRFRCWRRGGHGFVNLKRALSESCDVYFYLLGQRLGIEDMAKWLQRFGFGERTGFDLAFETSGLIGTPEWSRRVRGTPPNRTDGDDSDLDPDSMDIGDKSVR